MKTSTLRAAASLWTLLLPAFGQTGVDVPPLALPAFGVVAKKGDSGTNDGAAANGAAARTMETS